MKCTGIVRKIDDLGRIVIPKEIRTYLYIKENENLEIFVDEEKIILKKYDQFKRFETTIKEYVLLLETIFKLNIIVTNLEKVIVTSISSLELANKSINKPFLNILNERKKTICICDNYNWFENIYIKNNAFIYPLINNTELFGSIVLLSSREIKDIDKQFIELLVKLIKNNQNIV